jgi:NTP pyrophosphatase (non-canonical NTP hydrolase)
MGFTPMELEHQHLTGRKAGHHTKGETTVKTQSEMVGEFLDAVNGRRSHIRAIDGQVKFNLRTMLIAEEFKELCAELVAYTAALANEPEEELIAREENILKEMCDCLYVILYFCNTYGWNFDEAFRRVHASNMTKVEGGVIYDEDGKVMKSDSYKPADLEGCV